MGQKQSKKERKKSNANANGNDQPPPVPAVPPPAEPDVHVVTNREIQEAIARGNVSGSSHLFIHILLFHR